MNLSTFWGGAAGPYQIENSLRFRGAQRLTQAARGADTSRKWSMSFWAKLGKMSYSPDTQYYAFGASSYGNLCQGILFDFPNNSSYGSFAVPFNIGINGEGYNTNNADKLRDPSAWYHVFVRWDGTANSNAIRAWVNNHEVTWTQTKSGWYDMINRLSVERMIGCTYGGSYASYFDGYLAEFHFADNQTFSPTDFAEYNADGVWVPIDVSLTQAQYGTNGFYLDFSNPASIGADRSGNGNNFTPTGFELSTTTATEYDWVSDSPTKNISTGNPLANFTSEQVYTTDYGGGNLAVRVDNTRAAASSQAMTGGGKYYCEMKFRSLSGDCTVGVMKASWLYEFADGGVTEPSSTANAWAWFASGTKEHNNVESSYPGNGYNSSATVGIEFDLDSGNLSFWKNGSSQGVAYSGFDPDEEYVFYAHGRGSSVIRFNWNFGQQPYEYTTPSGIVPLSTAEMPQVAITKPSDYFKALTYQGNGSTLSVGGLDFSPDFVWIKNRTAGRNHQLFDTLRGPGKTLYSNLADQESTNQSGGYLSSFNANGFTVTGGAGDVNANDPYVAWCWKEQTGVFDVVTYSGTSSAQTIAHNLGAVPALMIIKCRNAISSWQVYHKDLGNRAAMFLDQSGTGVSNDNSRWNSTSPTTTHFTVGTDGGMNGSGRNFVAYLFAEVPGFSAFGTYLGNQNSDGPFVYTGFRPGWIMLKVYSGGNDDWFIWDTARDTYNVSYKSVRANNTSTEQTDKTNTPIDILSNGFKIRSSGTNINGNNYGFLYMAFAENPFGGGNVSPATAR